MNCSNSICSAVFVDFPFPRRSVNREQCYLRRVVPVVRKFPDRQQQRLDVDVPTSFQRNHVLSAVRHLSKDERQEFSKTRNWKGTSWRQPHGFSTHTSTWRIQTSLSIHFPISWGNNSGQLLTKRFTVSSYAIRRVITRRKRRKVVSLKENTRFSSTWATKHHCLFLRINDKASPCCILLKLVPHFFPNEGEFTSHDDSSALLAMQVTSISNFAKQPVLFRGKTAEHGDLESLNKESPRRLFGRCPQGDNRQVLQSDRTRTRGRRRSKMYVTSVSTWCPQNFCLASNVMYNRDVALLAPLARCTGEELNWFHYERLSDSAVWSKKWQHQQLICFSVFFSSVCSPKCCFWKTFVPILCIKGWDTKWSKKPGVNQWNLRDLGLNRTRVRNVVDLHCWHHEKLVVCTQNWFFCKMLVAIVFLKGKCTNWCKKPRVNQWNLWDSGLNRTWVQKCHRSTLSASWKIGFCFEILMYR